MTHHSDNPPYVAGLRSCHRMTDGVSPRKKSVCQGAIDDDNKLSLYFILRSEEAAAQQLYPHYAKIVRPRLRNKDARRLRFGRRPSIVKPERTIANLPGQRNAVGEFHRVNAGYPSDAINQLSVSGARALRRFCRRGGNADLECNDILSMKPWIHAPQFVNRAEQQARSG